MKQIQIDNKREPKLEPFFNPKNVLICGASGTKGKFGYQIIKNLDNLGYKGKIYLVNPNELEILGKRTYKSILEVPEVPELGIIVLPPQKVMRSIETCMEFGIKYLMIESSFLTKNMEEKISHLAKKYNVRVVGSNTIGIINFNDDFTTSIIPVRCIMREGNIGYIAQSGGLAGGCGWWNPENGLGFSKIVHLGDACDVDEAEVIDFLAYDDSTKVILLFLKNITENLCDKVKEVGKIKPILFLRPNKESKINILEKCNAIPVDNYQDLFEISKAFIQNPSLKGNRLGLIGPSSGALSLILSKINDYGFKLGDLTDTSKQILRMKVLHKCNQQFNPVDYWPPTKFDGIEVGEKYRIATETLLRDSNIDAVIIVLEIFKEIEFDIEREFKDLKSISPKKPIISVIIQTEKPSLSRILSGLKKLQITTYIQNIERSLKALQSMKCFYELSKKN